MNKKMNRKKVGILGATGMVGQRFVSLLEDHPLFEVVCVAASSRSAGKTYGAAVAEKWAMLSNIPESIKNLVVLRVAEDIDAISSQVDLVFCALDMDKAAIRAIEESYASKGIPVVSNNSAHRWSNDVPMIIPEVNPEHCELIKIQQKNRGWDKGFIVVKPNCSIQSYVPVLKALESFKPKNVVITTLQAISGAGKTFESWPEMKDNVIPLISGEEEKSEREPLKIFGTVEGDSLKLASEPIISTTCIRVPVSDGHMTSVSLSCEKNPTKEEFIEALRSFANPIADLDLPSAPKQFLKYFDEEDRPQTRLDRDIEQGMGITVGRFREDPIMGCKFVALSHNTVRGAAGGAILVAELLAKKDYF